MQIVFLAALPDQRSATWCDNVDVPVVTIDQYALSARILSSADVVITTMHQDQRWLYRQRDLLQYFLRTGGTLVLQGQVAIPFIPGLRIFEPMQRPSLDDYRLCTLCPEHPLFHGLNPEEFNQRRGVAGFYARGSNPPMEQARIISGLRGGSVPVDWIVPAGAGRVLMHSGNDLWTTFHEPEQNLMLANNLLRWAVSGGEPV